MLSVMHETEADSHTECKMLIAETCWHFQHLVNGKIEKCFHNSELCFLFFCRGLLESVNEELLHR